MSTWIVFTPPRPEIERVVGAVEASDLGSATLLARRRFGRLFGRVQSAASLESAAIDAVLAVPRAHVRTQPLPAGASELD